MLFLIFAAGGDSVPAADLLRWDLSAPTGTNTATTGTNGGPVPAAVALGISGSSLTGGGSAGNSNSPAGTWNRTFTTTENHTLAQEAGNFFRFTTTAAEGFTVSISGVTGMNLARTSVGPTTAGLFFSTDGGTTFTQTGTDFALVNTSLNSAAAAFSNTMAVTPVVIAGGQTVHWRLVVFGGSGNRLGIGNGGTADIVLTGTSVPDVAVRNLLWTGTGGQTWNTVPGNLNWADTGNANAPVPFRTDDNVTINVPGTITIDGGGVGVTAGNVVVGNPSGTLNLLGDSLTALTLTKTGAGIASFRGNNNFPGGTNLTGGTLQMESDGAFGSAPLFINEAVLHTTPDVTTVANAVDVGELGATFNNDAEVTFSGAMKAPGAANNTAHRLFKTGPGTLRLTNSTAAAFGSQMTINASGGAMELDINAGGVVFTGAAQRNLAGTNTWDGTVTLQGGIFMLHGGMVEGSGPPISIAGNASIRSRLNFGTATLAKPAEVLEGVMLGLDSANGNNFLTASGAITGGGGVNKTGNGTVRMEGDNSYAGITTIDAGILRVGTGTRGRLGQGDVQVNAGTLAFNRSDAFTVPNVISGAGSVTVAAATGITTLAGNNTYTGPTAVNTGTLRIEANSSSATGQITVAGGALLGGKGTTGGAVVIQAGGGLAARIRHWNGTVAGTDFDTLTVASLDAGGAAMVLVIDTADLTGFTESAKSFTILQATGAIINFSPGNVNIAAPGFAGSGTWSIAPSGPALILTYAPSAGVTYQTWAAGAPWNLAGADAAAGADPDGDGIPNAIEFVLGGNPATAPDQDKLPTSSISGSHLVFTFRRSTASAYLNPAAQYGSDPTGWTVAQHNVAGVTITENPAVAPGIDELVVAIPRPPAVGSPFFARLRVVVP